MDASGSDITFCSHLVGTRCQPKFRDSPLGRGTIVSCQPVGFQGVYDRTGIVLVIRLDSKGETIIDGADNWVTA